MLPAKSLAALVIIASTVAASPGDVEEIAPLVDSDWLAGRLGERGLVVLDVRNPYGGANRQTFEMGHIPGAVYSNYITDAWHDRRTPIPATLPPVDQLERLLGRLGISNETRTVIVHGGTNSSDFSAAARVYWLFRLVGHDRVSILDGGHRAWVAGGHPLEDGWNEAVPAVFRARFQEAMLATTAEVEAAAARGAQLVDGRARDLYEGREKAPLAQRAGTLPNAKNLDHRTLVDPDSGRLVSREALLALLDRSGIGPAHETVTFCNVGHWSAAAWFVLHAVLGYENVSLYDGSMVEWTAAPERAVMVPAATAVN